MSPLDEQRSAFFRALTAAMTQNNPTCRRLCELVEGLYFEAEAEIKKAEYLTQRAQKDFERGRRQPEEGQWRVGQAQRKLEAAKLYAQAARRLSAAVHLET